MSTRSQIGIYQNNKKPLTEFEALLYRHSDGYPSGVLPDIMPFLSWWSKNRGIDDTEYVSARLLQYLCNKHDEQSKELAKKYPMVSEEYSDEFTGTLGYGICKQFHWDIEYFYAISPEGVRVYDTPFEWDGAASEAKFLGIVPFENYEKNKNYKKLIKN